MNESLFAQIGGQVVTIMKKWVIGLSIILLLSILLGFVYIYYSAQKPLNEIKQTAYATAKEIAGIVDVIDFYLYTGSSTYYTVIGEDESGEQLVVWIPENSENDTVIKKLSDGISKEKAIELLYEHENPKKLLSVRLGMEKDLAIWELTYLDYDSKLNYYYIHFDTGKWWRKIENL